MLGTPSRLADGLRVSTTTTTAATTIAAMRTAHATTMTEDVDDATTATTTVTVVGRQNRGARELSARAYGMRGSPRVSGLRPMFPGTTRHQHLRMAGGLPAHVPRGESGRRPFHHQEPAALPQGLRADVARASALRQDQQLDRPALGLCRKLPRHVHPPRQVVGATQLQAAARGDLCEYIRHFSKRCTELPGATDNDAISAFRNGTTCTSLMHRLGRRMPRTTRELLNIARNHADGEEAVAAILNTP
jgi:hypothetical protein